MSRTNPREGGLSNPVKLSIVFKPNSGNFLGYDRTKKEQFELESLNMIILDADRFSITGFSDDHQANYISNYVYAPKKENFKVGVFVKGSYREVANGKYLDIKNEVSGMKFSKPIFALVEYEGELVLSEIVIDSNVARSSFIKWFYDNRDAVLDKYVTLSASKEVYSADKKTGEHKEVPKEKQKKWLTTWFKLLEIEFGEDLSDKEGDNADNADKEIQAYLKYLAGLNGDNNSPESPSKPKSDAKSINDWEADDDEDDLPF